MRVSVGDLRRVLKEALKRSDADQVAASLENAAGKTNAKVSASVDLSGKMLNVFVRLVSGDADAIEQALTDAASKLGWSLLSRSERRGTTWWFEPDPQTKGPTSSARLPVMLYHITPSTNVDGILEKGFELRQRSVPGTTRRYSPRIYLASTPGGAKATSKSGEDWTVLKVDRTKLPKGQKFYVDQEFGHMKDGTPMAVYTLDPIPPSAVSVA